MAADGLTGGREAVVLRFFEALEERFGKTMFEGEAGEQVTRQAAAAFDEALISAPARAPRLDAAPPPVAVAWEPALDVHATQALSTLRISPEGVALQRPWFQVDSVDMDATKVARALFGESGLPPLISPPSTPLAPLIADTTFEGSKASRGESPTLTLAGRRKKGKGSKGGVHRPAPPPGPPPAGVEGRSTAQLLLRLREQAAQQNEMGDWIAAIETSQIEVQITRKIAASDPVTTPALALALVQMAVRQRAAGMATEALAGLTEGVKLLRSFVHTDTTGVKALLGVALEEQSGVLKAFGRFEEALSAADEAVELFRNTTSQDGRVRLASALMNKDAVLAALDRHEEALATSALAVETWEQVAKAQVEFESALAESLNNMAIRLSAVGQPEQALVATERAVALQKRIAAATPGEPRPDLAIALTNLSLHHRGLGRHRDALKPAEEAVEIYRALMPRQSAVRNNYARALNNLAAVQLDLGEADEALASAEQAAAISRAIAPRSADIADAELAMALHTLGRAHAWLGDSEHVVESI